MTGRAQSCIRGRSVWHRVGAQLAEPRGTPGRALAHIMDRVNAVPLARAISAVTQLRPADVLEIGFGSGKGTQELTVSLPETRICGIDRSADMLARALKRNARAVANGIVQLVCGCADHLPWDDRSFDCVLGVNVAYFFGYSDSEMAEIFRVLRPGGRVVLYVTHQDDMARWPFASPSSHRHFDAHDLEALLTDGAFRNVEIRAVALPLGLTGLIGVGTKPGAL